jgi:hypothetical protein
MSEIYETENYAMARTNEKNPLIYSCRNFQENEWYRSQGPEGIPKYRRKGALKWIRRNE